MSTNNPKAPSDCLCNCGCNGLTKGGRFLPGHDAKLKKALVDAAMTGSRRAANQLEKLGWTKFLEAKRAKASGSSAVEVKPEEEPSTAQPEPAAAPRPRGRPRKVVEQTGEPAAQAAPELPATDSVD